MLDEPESADLERWLASDASPLFGSALLRVELVRATARVLPGTAEDALRLLTRMALVPLDTALLERAGRLGPPALRSLDAIHLVSALSVREHLTAFVAYDERLLAAATDAGLPVVAPGR